MSIWQPIDAADAGFDHSRLRAAVEFACNSDSDWPVSLFYPDGRYAATVYVEEEGPWSEVVGPVRPRGAPSGIILQQGMLVASWGDTKRHDMTFSVAKSYLALLAGVSVKKGLLTDLDEPVIERVKGPWFESRRNRLITWRHLLQQSSEWEGDLWGKPDTVDRYRQISVDFDNSLKGQSRPLEPPGSRFEYNDVRVNVLALALLKLFKCPLSEVLAQEIMTPIGAPGGWEWQGYRTSWIDIDGRLVQSVSGGGHWGGGLFISAEDHACVGQLVLDDGFYGEREILPAGWVRAMLRPSACNAGYGFLWWLNSDASPRYPSASASSVFALGGGAHLIWLDPDWQTVVVLRWIQRGAIDQFMALMAKARLQPRV